MVLGMSEQGKISETLDVSLENIPEAAFVSKKCFMADRGYGGTVFSSGEGIVVQVNEEEFVAKLGCFLSVRVHVNEELTLLKLLGKGFYYSSVMDASGIPVRDFWSGFVKVQNREITDPVFFRIEDIVRKVILYKSGNLRAFHIQLLFLFIPKMVICSSSKEKVSVTFGMATFTVQTIQGKQSMCIFL